MGLPAGITLERVAIRVRAVRERGDDDGRGEEPHARVLAPFRIGCKKTEAVAVLAAPARETVP